MNDIQLELNQAFEELKSLQKETKLLNNEKKMIKDSLNRTKIKKTSSWALSSTTRSGIPTTMTSFHGNVSSPELMSQEKKTSKGFTISKTIKRSIFDSSSNSTKEEFYDTNIDILSSKKRSRSAIMSKSERNISFGDDSGRPNQEEQLNEKVAPSQREEPTARVYSFNKATRIPDSTPQNNYSELDLDSAEKLIRERSQCAIFPKEKREIERSPKLSTPSEPLSLNIELLSNRVSSNTGGKIAPPKSTKSRRSSKIDQSDYGNPGPGAYTDSINKVYSISNSSGKGAKFSSATTTEKVRAFQKKKRMLEVHAPGPGSYDVSTADAHVRTKVAGFSNIFRPYSAEQKNTPQLERKKYWEDKARDAREEPDEKRESSFEFVKKRTPIVSIRPDERKGIDYRNRHIIRKIQAEKMREASIGYYDKKYGVIEREPPAPVLMERQVRSEANTKAMLDSAGIIPASQKRAIEAAKRDYYLGPQLQVPWEEDRSAMKDSNISPHDSGDESPTEEVLRLIRARNQSEDGTLPDTTDAYLRSSYTGTLGSRPSTVRMSTNVRKIFEVDVDQDAIGRDYLPTQLHHDWGEPNTGDYRGQAVRMDSVPGRETKKVHKKGVVETVAFHEAPRLRPDDYAPGDYDGGRKFGEGVRGAFDFDRYVSRAELTGPNGERPENDIDFENDDIFNEEVIVDAPNAKERLLRHFEGPKLYTNDRYEQPKKSDEGLNQLGGQWFRGMASETKHAVVKYDAMVGRDKDDSDSEYLENDQFLSGDELILDVKDWKPNKVTTQLSGPAWVDPKLDPRFGKEKKSAYTGDDGPVDLNHDYLKPREGLHVLNMKNLQDRWANDEREDEAVQNEIYENNQVERKKNILDAIDEDRQIRLGEEMQSSKKRSINFVDMKQQRSRPTNINKSDAPDISYNINDSNKDRPDLGVRNWELTTGRDSKVITKEKVYQDINSDDEEVVISPKTSILSSSKRPLSAPAWNLQKDKKQPDHKEPLGNQLQYDIDQAFADNVKGGGKFAQHDGPINLKFHEIAGDEFQEEELDLDPNFAMLKHINGENASGVPWSKKSDLKERFAEKRNDVIKTLEDQPGQILDLEIPQPSSQKLGKFSQVDVDEKRPGASNVLRSLRNDKEELDLHPVDVNKERKNTLANWKKQATRGGIIEDKKILGSDVVEEELILSPHSPKTQKNHIAQWNKQVTKFDSSSSLNEELILSPKVELGSTKGGPSWSKQETKLFSSDNTTPSQEELILSPKKLGKSSGKSKFRPDSDVTWMKLSEVDDEELILNPHDPSINRVKIGPSWKDTDIDALRYPDGRQSSEELILSPTESRTVKTLSGKWNRQNDILDELKQNSEELILSPKHPVRPNQATFWKNQSEKEPAQNIERSDQEEVMIFPTTQSKKSQKKISTNTSTQSSKPQNIKKPSKKVSFESTSKSGESMLSAKNQNNTRNDLNKSSKPEAISSNNQNNTALTPPKLQTLSPSETAVPYSFQKNSGNDIDILNSKLRDLGV